MKNERGLFNVPHFLALLFVLCSVLFVSCDLPDAMGGKGVVTINLGGSGNSRAVWYGIDTDNFTLTVTVTNGPGPEQTQLADENNKAQFTLIPGTWDIIVKAYHSDEYASLGSKAVVVAEGKLPGVSINPGPNEITESINMELPKDADVCIVTFISFDNEEFYSTKVLKNVKVTAPLNHPTRNDHTFGGWYTDDETFDDKWEFATPITTDTTLYAKWIVGIVYYTVTFNANDGTGTAPAAQTVPAGSEITLPDAGNLAKTGYTFIGWNTNAEGTGTPYAAGDSYTVNADGSLFAMWTVIPAIGVTLNKRALALNLGEMERLTVIMEPANATNKTVTWTSNPPGMVDNRGWVTAVAGGGIVTVTTADGGFTDTCTVTVYDGSSSSNSFRISTVEQLQKVTGEWSGPNNHYMLTENISLAIEDFTWLPRDFSGIFEGNGKTISGLSDTSSSGNMSLFSAIASASTVNDLTVDCDINTDGDRVAGIAGVNSGTIYNCTVSGIIEGGDWVGGIAVGNMGTIENCFVSGTIIGKENVGGITSDNNGTISNSHSSANVTGNRSVGGIAGSNGGTIEYSSYIGTVTGKDTEDIDAFNIGGIAGGNDGGTITSCYVTGLVTGEDNGKQVGGIVGSNTSGAGSTSSIENCYATATVKGSSKIGGVVGYNWGTGTSIVRVCYAAGSVEGEAKVVGEAGVGGIAGSNSGSILSCVALNPTITNSHDTVAATSGFGRVVGDDQSGTIDFNHARDDMVMEGWNTTGIGTDQPDGAGVGEGTAVNQYNNTGFWENIHNAPDYKWNFGPTDAVWKMTTGIGNLPKLVWEQE